MAKEKTPSLQEAAEAYIALLDSGGGSTRRLNRVLGLLRDAVHAKGAVSGPIVPDDLRPGLDDEQEQAAETNVWDSARIFDLVHPGGRLQQANETLETILKKAEEGTLAQDEAREGLAKRRAERKKAADKAEKSETKAAAKPATKAATKTPITHVSASGSTLSNAPTTATTPTTTNPYKGS